MRILAQRACGALVTATVLLGTAAGCGSGKDMTAGWAPGSVGTVTAADIGVAVEGAAGRVLVLNFWATWCAPCVAEMPELAAFYRDYADTDDVALYGISLDAPDTLDGTITPFLKEKDIPFAIRVLTERDVEAVSKAVHTEISGALPMTLVYDRKGRLVRTWEGAITQDELNGLVKPLL